MNELDNLIAVVTGAGSGIGLAVATQLNSLGVKVFGLDINEGEMKGVAEYVACDVGDTAQVKKDFETISSRVNHIDMLFNVAGVGAVGAVEDATDDEWHRVMNINVAGTSRVSATAMPLLRKSASASITNTASIAATAGLPNRAVYSASKGAVQSLTLAMAADCIKEKIRVNAVNPGTANTPWVKRLLGLTTNPEAELAALQARQPMGRLVEADEVASAMIYLASPAQKSTTGTILAVDGGMQGLRIPK